MNITSWRKIKAQAYDVEKDEFSLNCDAVTSTVPLTVPSNFDANEFSCHRLYRQLTEPNLAKP